MHLAKSITLILASSGMLLLGSNIYTHPVQAASWHKGVPSFMKIHFYRTKLEPKYVKMAGKWVPINSRRSEDIHIYKSNIRYLGYQDAAKLKNCHYTHKGKYLIIKGKYDKYMHMYPALKVRKVTTKVIYAGIEYYNHNRFTSTTTKLRRMTRIH